MRLYLMWLLCAGRDTTIHYYCMRYLQSFYIFVAILRKMKNHKEQARSNEDSNYCPSSSRASEFFDTACNKLNPTPYARKSKMNRVSRKSEVRSWKWVWSFDRILLLLLFFILPFLLPFFLSLSNFMLHCPVLHCYYINDLSYSAILILLSSLTSLEIVI